MKEDRTRDRHGRRIAFGASALLLVQIGIGAGLTWGTWPDVLIDFGREWYVPMRIAAGDVLYRDLAYFNGPLSPWLNAGLMSLFGPTLRTLVWANLAVLFLFELGLYALLARIATRASAFLGASLVIWLCAFSQYLYVGNYNWVCPYSHETTHGLLLSVGALLAADRFSRSGTRAWLVLTGVVCGLVFLTKSEIALAAYAGVAVLLCGPVVDGRRNGRRAAGAIEKLEKLEDIALLGVGFLLPIVLAGSVLARSMPLNPAWQGVLGSWKLLAQTELTGSEFYQAVMGTASIEASVALLYGWTALYAAVLGCAVWIAKGRASGARQRVLATAVLCVLVTGFWLLGGRLDWLSVARPWPLILAALAISFAVQWRRRRGQPEKAATDLLRLSVVVWSGALLLKIVLYCRVFHYGFSLAAPALAVVACAGCDWWPAWLKRRGVSAPIARAGVLALIVAGTVFHVSLAATWRQKHTVAVGSGANRFLADERGATVNRLLAEIAEKVPPDASLACMPEGVMINALSGRRTSLKYRNFVPTDMLIYGETEMLDDLRASAPDWIAMINRDTSEYGAAAFTVDYAQEIGRWIDAHYEVRAEAGAPFMTADPGFMLLRRLEPLQP